MHRMLATARRLRARLRVPIEVSAAPHRFAPAPAQAMSGRIPASASEYQPVI
jgi:hypothetical protein